MVTVRCWNKEDIDFVAESIEQENWGHVKGDVERCFNLEPNGCFISEVEGKPVGHVFSIAYGKLGWIGLLIVNPEFRERGIGALLMQTAINYLKKAGVETIRLEAAEKAVPLYRRLGFREEFDSLRYRKMWTSTEKFPQKPSKLASQMEEEDLKRLVVFAAEYFGSNRRQVLKNLYKDYPLYCFVTKKRKQNLGYIMGRKVKDSYQIGPWICNPRFPNIAEGLLLAFRNAIKEEKVQVRIGMPALNSSGVQLMKKLGFELVSKSLRMLWGKHEYSGKAIGVYGIGGPEKG